LNEHNKPKWLFSISASLIYPIANRIIAVSYSVSYDINAINFGLEHRMSVIFNPIIPPDFEFKKIKEITNIRRLIWVGRLENSKNPELMLDAFLLLSENYFLDFIGDGALKLKLENKCKKHGLEKRINFRGFQSNVYEWMINADILVVTSDHEGFGNVLVEALYCGLRIVSTDCRGGIRDILCNEKYGKLVPIRNPNALAIAIENSYNISYGIEFQKEGGERFLPEVITEQFLNEILA
jgi:glycosyltransferase involved in cell wall biosynthesis